MATWDGSEESSIRGVRNGQRILGGMRRDLPRRRTHRVRGIELNTESKEPVQRDAGPPGWDWTIALKVALAIIVILALQALLLFGAPGRRAHEEDHPAGCSDNLYLLGRSLLAYAGQYDDYLPFSDRGELASLSLLYPKFYDDPSRFVCPDALRLDTPMLKFPAGVAWAGSPCSYGYAQGLKVGAPPDTPVMWDLPQNHGRKRICVLYLDGHVRWLEGKIDPRGEKSAADH